LKVAWQTDVQAAWRATVANRRPLLVFVTHDHCYYCTQMKRHTYASPLVAAAIDGWYVPLELDGGSPSALLKDLKVTQFPVTFVISPRAEVLARFDGYVSPEALAGRLKHLRAKPNLLTGAAMGGNRAWTIGVGPAAAGNLPAVP
jgi:protein disulfide-isomerase